MARLRREHRRLLGNGYCTRRPELDCAFEAISETCTFFRTSLRSDPPCNANDHAADHNQSHRADLFDRLLSPHRPTRLMIDLTAITCIRSQCGRLTALATLEQRLASGPLRETHGGGTVEQRCNESGSDVTFRDGIRARVRSKPFWIVQG
jgi:hypothetical protein